MAKGKRLGTAGSRVLLVLLFAACLPLALLGAGTVRANLPRCDSKKEDCGCSCDQVSADCIKVNLGLGATTPWTGSMACSLKIFADDDSPSIFTPESLYAVLGGYTFKRLGPLNLSDGRTPAEVVMSHPNGEAVHFVFADGESVGRPDPGVHIKMDERLMMVDAGGWAVTHDPVYYDLYVGDGSRRRFLATNMTGALGELVSITDERGVTVTPADMGVEIIYDSCGVRQFLTPSRLADVTQHPGFAGYDVKVYAIQEPPAKEAGLYVIPSAQPVERVSVSCGNDWRRAVVTIQKGGGEPMRHVFNYAMGDWSLTRPSGMEERKECFIADERAAQVTKTDISRSGEVLAKKVKNFKWESWGFAMTNRVEGFGGVTDTTSWTYYTSGNGKGQVKTEQRQSGLLIQYAYDNLDRKISETRSGPDMMTETTTYDYTPVDAGDPVLPIDTRPRTVVKTLDGIECERTYYVYAPLTNVVERVGTQGAAYGGTNALRTVTAFYPVAANDARSGFVASIRYEDGKLDLYDYELSSNIWVRTITHLHEQSPAPVSGKTTRDVTITNARGEILEERTEAFVDDAWHVIARERNTYNAEGKIVQRENLAGQVTTTAWDCCHKISETEPDGSTTTWDYDEEGRMISSSRLIPLDMTNVTWLTTCYEYDDLGRQVATWQTNFAAQVGLPATCTRYDHLGRIIARVDQLGNTTTTSYSPDGRTVSVQNPNTAAVVYSRNADGDTLSITGSAVTPEFHTYGISPDGTRWSRTVQGETASSPRFTKRCENLLGQTIREERSGFKGAVLATSHSFDSLGRLVSTAADYEPITEYTYDTLGNRIATTRIAVTGTTGVPPVEWRKTETLSSFVLNDTIVWLTQTNTVSCSDATIAPLVSSSARQLTGLTPALPERSHSTDIRGNVTENEMLVESSLVTSRQTVPYASNKPLSISRYGVSLMDVSVSAVTNTVAYDPFGRQIANTDGRGNTRQTEYNSFGQRSASIDAFGNRTSYAYDQFGNLASVTDPLGNAIVYEYDLRGRKTYEGGATYPVRYTYDIFGNKTTMMTYRNESLGPDSGDITTWLYDEASGAMTNKVYANGKGPTYSYTPDGMLSRRIWARGIVTDYIYDGWGNLTNTVYSDDTPTVSCTYDVLGRQTLVHDAAGATSFFYDPFGSLTNEIVVGVAGTNIIERCWDDYGRTVGYSLNGTRQSTIGYGRATGRIATMIANGSDEPFVWSYHPGTDLKSSLVYPNGLTTTWQYDANSQMLQVCNAFPTNVISQYDYAYDAVGRRILIAHSNSAISESHTYVYDYNARGELISAAKEAGVAEYAYEYDDIGNRLTSFGLGTNRTYIANNLNQYTSISNSASSSIDGGEIFNPRFDDDGNQTLIQNSTGIWSVTYNGENRPFSWSNGTVNIIMQYDCRGRRVQYIEICGSTTNANNTFIYDNYLLVSAKHDNFDGTFAFNCFVWDVAELVATRPLVFYLPNAHPQYYSHDGNKNVTGITMHFGEVSAQYEYSPFGVLVSCSGEFILSNPFRFSSEYVDDALGGEQYNFRHYNGGYGRWFQRDPSGELDKNTYAFAANAPVLFFDYLGLRSVKSIQCIVGGKIDGIIGPKTVQKIKEYQMLLINAGLLSPPADGVWGPKTEAAHIAANGKILKIKATLTYYCACKICCGEKSSGITADGTKFAEGVVAAPCVIPFGSTITYTHNGQTVTQTVHDRGGKIVVPTEKLCRFDIGKQDHDECKKCGKVENIDVQLSLAKHVKSNGKTPCDNL